MQRLFVGLDVGSTTVKAIVVDAATNETLRQDYQRHETRQPEKVLEFLNRMETDANVSPENTRIFVTGSGGGTITEMIGAKFVQEVHAVSLAVEKLHPEVYSVIELGGQDAKIIVFKDDEETGRKKKIPSMNDKCAGGTGAVIDKINAKLKIPAAHLSSQAYLGVKLERLFGDEVRAGLITHPLDISDVWKNRYSTSTNHKVWAAKFTARHPNLVALEVSSFKCGHDASIYGVIEGIIEQSGTPYFSFKDLDENKPSGSIRIRVETIDYFLRRYRDDIIQRRKVEGDIEAQLAAFERSLRQQSEAQYAVAGD
jgi:BadF/BadG/BcrA/BcrD ATPase family protein